MLLDVTFRFLKHANGLLHFHTKDPDLLKQEVYANLILYNLRIFLANEVAKENRKKNRKQNKYAYEVDVSSALKLARKFLLCKDSLQPGQIYILFFCQMNASIFLACRFSSRTVSPRFHS